VDGAEPSTPEPKHLTKLAEGREAEIFSWGEHEVLRLYRDPQAHERAKREALALDAVRTALPGVPALHGRMDWDGRPGLRMQRLDGRAILAEIQRRPWRVWTLARLCGRVHADVNRVRAPETLPDLRSELKRRIEGLEGAPTALRAAALEELYRLPDGDALCHGDFQPDNVLLCSTGPAVIDWPNATRGDPCGDFARTVLMLKAGSLPPGAPPLIRWAQWAGRGLFARAYMAGYQETTRYDEQDLRRWHFVRAVDRLADHIAEERDLLLRTADRLRRRLEPRAGSFPNGS
jgi:aminoglycoside phosphotransferase (APT) family kinase protein